MSHDPLLVLAGLVVAGVLAQWLAGRVGVPSIVLLLATGLLLGPLTGVLVPDALFGSVLDPLVSLAVAVVLFEGGLSLRLSEARKLGWPLLRLVLGGLVVSFVLTTLLGHALAGLSWPVAAVVGAILVVTGPTVIKPMLRQARLAQRPARLLRWEGIVNDPLGALLAVLVLEGVLLHGELQHAGVAAPLAAMVGRVVLAGLGGALLGGLLGKALERGAVPEHLKAPVILAGVLLAFAVAEQAFHEAGLLAVTTMGVVLANGSSPSLEAIRQFKETVATVLVAVLFLVLSARIARADLLAFDPGVVLLVLAILFVVRPLTVWTALLGTDVPRAEKLLVGWIAPRGIVAAAMAGALAPRLVAAGYPDARAMVPVVFGVIVLSVALHGFTVAPLARRLGLAGRSGGGVLVLGVSAFSLELCRALKQAGVDVLCVDESWRSVSQARLAGLDTVHGDVLEESTLDELPLERFDWLLAATRDDAYNSLACVALGDLFGRDHVLQLTPRAEPIEGEPSEGRGAHLQGRRPWGEPGSFSSLAARTWGGRHVKSTKLSAEYDWDAFRAQNAEAAVLFEIDDARVRPLGRDEEPSPEGRLVWVP